MSPLLTIAIPTYNRATDLDRLLASAVREIATVPQGSVELLVIDNASDDHTPQVVAKHAQQCPSLRNERNPANIGMQANFGRCMDICQGDYLYMIGDDEIFLPGGVQTILETLQSGQASVYLFNYTNEAAPQLNPFLQRVAGKPIDTSLCTVRDYVYRHGWFWTLANLGMVAVKSAPLRGIDRTPHMGHTFMQSAIYLTAFADEKILFVNKAVFHTFIRSQTVNKERWKIDGNIASWPQTSRSLTYLIQTGVLPPHLPTLFFNSCSAEWQPVWQLFLDAMNRRVAAGDLSIADVEWDNVRTWASHIDDPTRRDNVLNSIDALRVNFVITKASLENYVRVANLLQTKIMGL